MIYILPLVFVAACIFWLLACFPEFLMSKGSYANESALGRALIAGALTFVWLVLMLIHFL